MIFVQPSKMDQQHNNYHFYKQTSLKEVVFKPGISHQ